ncbi:MAG TPA: RNA polymerase sigma factor [Patescibacteria group bacterium]|jgi:RNA polymerase sigma-70 factor (ECF subfamily)|nr:RNA polymerase sigma factor [Patescibacteria group bacterium]
MVEENKIQEWVKEAQGGDTEAFGALYDAFSQRIYNFLFARLRHKQTAEDLAGTVFLKAWANLKQYQPRANAKFGTWLFQIANFTLIDHWRTRKETAPLDKIDNLSSFAFDQKLYEDYEFLWIAISQLPLEYQSVLDLRFKQELSVTETAYIMKKSEVGIRVLQHRALKLLKEKLRDMNIDETL